jgi:hypothetical protein
LVDLAFSSSSFLFCLPLPLFTSPVPRAERARDREGGGGGGDHEMRAMCIRSLFLPLDGHLPFRPVLSEPHAQDGGRKSRDGGRYVLQRHYTLPGSYAL